MDAEVQARRIARYYRWLDRLMGMRAMRRETGNQAQPVHRALRDPAGGPASPLVVHRLMLEGLALPAAPRVLDAGCGYGATAMDLLPRLGGEWLGVTLSPVQAERGSREAARRGLAGQLRFAVQSYDQPLAGPFDLAIAIESLIHSIDPARSIGNIATQLAPGGYLVVVDDMPEPVLAPADAADVALFRRMWRCPVAPPLSSWTAAMQAAGLEILRTEDLSPLLLARPEAELAAPLARQKRRAFWLGLLGLGLREEADIGGMTLEMLQRRGAMRYWLLVARKPLLAAADTTIHGGIADSRAMGAKPPS